VSFTLIESLPKEKTTILGQAESCMYSRFLSPGQFDENGKVMSNCETLFAETLVINYTNPKLLAPNQEVPCLKIELSLTKPLLSAEAILNGIFANISLDTLHPLPEDWSIREGSEKDLNSSIINLIRFV
jgi:hypothetical protein